MQTSVYADSRQAGEAAARDGAELIRQAIADRGSASIIVATGASQFDMLSRLVEAPGVDWNRVTMFHLDEYVGLPIAHPASFRRYLWERFISRLPLPLAAFQLLDGETDAAAECRRVSAMIQQHEVDVAFVGIGENGHLAFNDPPADFETDTPYIVVELDEACRRQQVGEGWFPGLESTPTQAISMSIRQILKSKAIVCTVPDERKAQAVQRALEGEVCRQTPASILQQHEQTRVYLDEAAASRLSNAPQA
ncbi:Glucosamine-6-phosphate deaminase 1 [Posidoniimonas polymericola]|uniref:Glucosamine-6-phosphate deaminase 1 n=1 Tax=Posidoniimonas polymericola TaxID=2528002 RepID=A0A5C5YT98_9BACT|nr:glucosamine-6-phosphate deaminase [Posidoniimonas polymericola]TWT78224.1 Glucosamine-6-phosphate deaminase 1 [Posidoniimonas polymericola]